MSRLREALRPDDGREAIRSVAGLLIAVGLLLVAIRGGSAGPFPDPFGEPALLLVYALAAGLLYGMGIAGRLLAGRDRRWQALYTVLGALILPLALFQLATVIDAGYDRSLVAIFVFAACAAAALIAWRVAAVRFQLLLGAVYFALSWVALVNEALPEGVGVDLDAARVLILLLAGALALLAAAVRRRAPIEPEAAYVDLLTGAGVAALIALSLGVVATLATRFVSSLGPLAAFLIGPVPGSQTGQSWIWDLLTLLIGIALVLFGLGRGLRGPVYVGGAALAVFLLSVGFDLDDPSPEGTLAGWPLLICAAGVALLALSFAREGAVGAWLGHRFQGGREP